jgi:putative transposase
MPYWRLHYHLDWATYQREPMITSDCERIIYATLHQKANELDAIIHAIGNIEDHIHVVASIPPKIAVAECIRQFKGASSHAVSQTLGNKITFKWQSGYGAISIGERSLPTIMDYAKNQKRHHAENTTIEIYEQMTDDEDGIT